MAVSAISTSRASMTAVSPWVTRAAGGAGRDGCDPRERFDRAALTTPYGALRSPHERPARQRAHAPQLRDPRDPRGTDRRPGDGRGRTAHLPGVHVQAGRRG